MCPDKDEKQKFDNERQIQTPNPTIWDYKFDQSPQGVQSFSDFNNVQQSQDKHFVVSPCQHCGQGCSEIPCKLRY
jgi:hypothetical protein